MLFSIDVYVVFQTAICVRDASSMLEMPHHGSLRCVFKMIMGKYVHLYDFGKTCALVIIITNASHFAPLNPFI